MTSWSPAPSRCTCTSAPRRARPRQSMPRCAPGSRRSRRAGAEAILDDERGESGGERVECLAMTEPQAGSDLRSMRTSARAHGADFIINGTKHFISHADHADYVILFAASGEEDSPRGKRRLITAFLIDKGTPGFEVRPGYRNVSHRGYTNSILA